MSVIRALLAVALLCLPLPVSAAEPVVAVWYRGAPAGTPRQDDLAVIRALGFNGVVWPAAQTRGVESLKTMAAVAGLQVHVAAAPRALTASSALTPAARADIVVTPANVTALSAFAWRAVAHGARAIAFDAGATDGAGLHERDGSLKPWVKDAIDFARQVTGNARLVEALAPGPGVTVAPVDGLPADALDVTLLDGDRSWVLVATNLSTVPVRATVRLPAGAPYAIWVSWIDGSTLAMAGEAAGPRWSLQADPGGVRVYLIDKVAKTP